MRNCLLVLEHQGLSQKFLPHRGGHDTWSGHGCVPRYSLELSNCLPRILWPPGWQSLLPVPLPGSLIQGAPVLCSGPYGSRGCPVHCRHAHLFPLLVKLLLIGTHNARVRVLVGTWLSQGTGATPGDGVGLLCSPTVSLPLGRQRFLPQGGPSMVQLI